MISFVESLKILSSRNLFGIKKEVRNFRRRMFVD